MSTISSNDDSTKKTTNTSGTSFNIQNPLVVNDSNNLSVNNNATLENLNTLRAQMRGNIPASQNTTTKLSEQSYQAKSNEIKAMDTSQEARNQSRIQTSNGQQLTFESYEHERQKKLFEELAKRNPRLASFYKTEAKKQEELAYEKLKKAKEALQNAEIEKDKASKEYLKAGDLSHASDELKRLANNANASASNSNLNLSNVESTINEKQTKSNIDGINT